MKAITITQPWASLIAIGAKRIETRSWSTRYRGPLAIHAGAGLGPVGGQRSLAALLLTEPFRSVLAQAGMRDSRDLPRGCILAVGELVAVFPTGATNDQGTSLSAQERAFGDYTAGRYGWQMENVRSFSSPVPTRGALGLWEWEPPDDWLARLQPVTSSPRQ
jgi:hypothetical protein